MVQHLLLRNRLFKKIGKLYSLFEECLRLSPLANGTSLDVSFSSRGNEDGIVDLLDVSKKTKTNNVSIILFLII